MMNRKRLLSLLLALAMVFSLVMPASAAEHDHTLAFHEVNGDRIQDQLNAGHVADVTPEKPAYAEDEVLRVSIFLEKKGTIDAGYAPMGIASNTAALNYKQALGKEQKAMEQKISKAIGQELDVVWNLTLAANLISANVQFGQIEDILAVPGVAKVVIETRYEPAVVNSAPADPNMATSGVQTGSFNAWAAGYTGAGSRVAIIDTGLDVYHEAFHKGAYEYALSVLAEKAGKTTEEYVAGLDLLDAWEINAVLKHLNAYSYAYNDVTAEDLYVSSKIPFGYNYVDQDLDLSHYESEHGSHVAGIATANTYIPSDDGYAKALNITGVQGVASDAQVLVMKVFGEKGGAWDSDYMAAIEDAVLLGCDSVNLSLGSAAPGAAWSGVAEYEAILENLQNSGVVVAISAGNNSHWTDSAVTGLPYADDAVFHTGGSPGTFRNSLCVASANNAGTTIPNYFVLGGEVLDYYESLGYGNSRMQTLAGEQPYVYVDGYGTVEEFATLGREVLAGKIVLCNRGQINFSEKANNAAAMGAIGVIVVNNEYQNFRMDLSGYRYDVPVASVNKYCGDCFAYLGTGLVNGEVMYYTGVVTVAGTPIVEYYNGPYKMSSFSSWGVPGNLVMKPEITAPGGGINSVAGAIESLNAFTDHASYELMDGTSMAAPQVAGMAAVLIQYLRENGLDQVAARTLAQSLLMSTAKPMKTESGNYYPILQQGAGMANVGEAVMADSYILMGEDATASWADGKVKVELGDDPNKVGEYTFSFTLNNLTDMEKVFTLSGDFFIQALWGENTMLDTETRFLAPAIEWTVNGKPVETGASLSGMDFDGNGAVNYDDGQALVDYSVGKIYSLSNQTKADLNGDGTINTYDAYLFFDLLRDNGVILPANGTAQITATVKLTQADREILADYPNGTYLQGYVFAESLATEEGVDGTSHSIPVLGFYGNWSDPSMFDKGSAAEYLNGTETRNPYLYYENYLNRYYNGLVYRDASNGKSYWYGGNPFVQDATYMPERDAFSAVSGDEVTDLEFTTIRTAGGMWYFVRNLNTGEYLEFVELANGPVAPAYYSPNYGAWQNTQGGISRLGFDGYDLPDGTKVEIGAILPPEYYVDENMNLNLEALGKGATFSMTFTIDNQAPEMKSLEEDKDNKLLRVIAQDNQYVAAVALYDEAYRLLTYTGSNPEADAAEATEFCLDIAQVGGDRFFLEVYDYAGNTKTYEVNQQLGEVAYRLDAITVDPVQLSLIVGDTDRLVANLDPINTAYTDVIWSSSDENVVAVDQNGNILAVGAGYAYVNATSAYNSDIYGFCYVEVKKAVDADLNALIWDEYGRVLYSQFNTKAPHEWEALTGDLNNITPYGTLNAACVGTDGTLYVSSVSSKDQPDGALYTMDPDTYELDMVDYITVQGIDIFFADMTYAPAMFTTGVILGVYDRYVAFLDPVTGNAGFIDELHTSIVGISTVKSSCFYHDQVGWVYDDYVMLVLADGTVIYEDYYGYGGGVVPANQKFENTRIGWNTGIDVGGTWYLNSAYFDTDSQILYWAALNLDTDNTTSLYALDLLGDRASIYYKGNIGDRIWPAAGLHQQDVAPSLIVYATGDNGGREEFMALDLENLQYPVVDENALAEVKVGFAAGRKSAESSGSSSAVRSEEDTVIVELTAKDSQGNPLDSYNGRFDVYYDPTEMTLVDVTVNGQYTAWKDLDGVVTIGYVDMDGIAAGEVVVTLEFRPIAEGAELIVNYYEVNDQIAGISETVTFGCEHQLDHVLPYDPTCVKEGLIEFWYCGLCDKYFLDAAATQEIGPEDIVIPATGHTWGEWVIVEEPTDETTGLKQRACTVCGHTEQEVIPSTGAVYGDANGDSVVNGKDLILLRQYLAGWDVTVLPENADANGDSVVNGKDLILLRQYLAGWDVTLGPKPEEAPQSVLGTWVYVTRKDWEGEDIAVVDIAYMEFNADGTGYSWFENWSNYDLLYGRPADGWVDITPPYSDNSFTYTLSGDRLTVTYAPIEDFEIEAETEVYTLAWNEDGSLTIHYPDDDERTYKPMSDVGMSLEELLELFGFDPNAPGQYEGPEIPVEPDWIVGEWTNVTREDYYDEDFGVWRATVTEDSFIFNADSTGMMGGYEWTNWDYINGGPGDHWEIAPMGYEWPSFTYTLAGDRLTVNIEYYDMTGDEPDLITVTDVYIVTKNADGSITLTREDNEFARVYRRVEEDTTLEEKLALFGLDPNVPEN